MCKCIGCQNESESENYEFDRNNEYDSAEKTASKIYLLFVCFKNRFNIITFRPTIDSSC